MAVLTLKGIVSGVGNIQEIGDKKTKVQFLYLHVAAFPNEFGEKKGEDNDWCLKAIGKVVDDFNLSAIPEGQKVEVKCYIDSRYVNHEGKLFYSIECKIANLIIL